MALCEKQTENNDCELFTANLASHPYSSFSEIKAFINVQYFKEHFKHFMRAYFCLSVIYSAT